MRLQALGVFYERAYLLLYGQALGSLRSPEAAHDLVHDAFADATAIIRRGAEIRCFDAWFRTVVRNSCITGNRARPAATEALTEELVAHGAQSPPEIAHHKRRLDAVYRAVRQLPATQRSAFLLAEMTGLRYREIAGGLGKSEDSVRQLLLRARRHVRDAVGANARGNASPARPDIRTPRAPQIRRAPLVPATSGPAGAGAPTCVTSAAG